jgi:hypothetical protein
MPVGPIFSQADTLEKSFSRLTFIFDDYFHKRSNWYCWFLFTVVKIVGVSGFIFGPSRYFPAVGPVDPLRTGGLLDIEFFNP